MSVEFKIKEVGWIKEDESISRVIAVATFNNGYSHIVPDDNCWVLLNGGKPSPWIFREAMKVLRDLPNTPAGYLPLNEHVGRKY